METPYSRRHQPPSPSPRLARSRSGSSATSVRVTSPGMQQPSSASQRFGNNRSKSTTKTRTHHNNNNKASANKDEDTRTPNIPSGQKKPQESSFAAKFLPRGGLRAFGGGTAPKPAASAWALSPGRSLQLAESSPAGAGRAAKANKSGGGVGGVLRYFRQKKVSPVQEEEFHRFRVLHNGLLQWRFANARAELAIAATKSIAQSRLFSVWLRIYKMRNSIVEKRIQVQRLKCEIKLYEILNPQVLLLGEWAKLDRRNQESVAKLMAKLSGISVRLPLIHGAKADVMSVYEAMSEAVDAMDGIEAIITRFFSQVERILYMVTELLITNKQNKENLEELEKSVSYVAALVDKETSIRTHCIQAALDSARSQKLLTSF